jgi:hypothetical protein
VQNQEVGVVLGRIQVALPASRYPGDNAVLQVEQVHGVGGAAPEEILDRRIGTGLGRQIVGVRMLVVVEQVDQRHALQT